MSQAHLEYMPFTNFACQLKATNIYLTKWISLKLIILLVFLMKFQMLSFKLNFYSFYNMILLLELMCTYSVQVTLV